MRWVSGIMSFSPVWGCRPSRSLWSFVSKLPKLDNRTGRFSASDCAIQTKEKSSVCVRMVEYKRVETMPAYLHDQIQYGGENPSRQGLTEVMLLCNSLDDFCTVQGGFFLDLLAGRTRRRLYREEGSSHFRRSRRHCLSSTQQLL